MAILWRLLVLRRENRRTKGARCAISGLSSEAELGALSFDLVLGGARGRDGNPAEKKVRMAGVKNLK